jgi:hypothetical protein
MVLGRIIVSESKYDHLLFTFFMFISHAVTALRNLVVLDEKVELLMMKGKF